MSENFDGQEYEQVEAMGFTGEKRPNDKDGFIIWELGEVKVGGQTIRVTGTSGPEGSPRGAAANLMRSPTFLANLLTRHAQYGAAGAGSLVRLPNVVVHTHGYDEPSAMGNLDAVAISRRRQDQRVALRHLADQIAGKVATGVFDLTREFAPKAEDVEPAAEEMPEF